MDGEFSLDLNIDTVCLPRPEEKFDKSSCFVTGWGTDASGEKPNIMRSLKQLTVDETNCEMKVREGLGKHFELVPSQICAGGIPGRDTCQGSGGDALMCPGKGPDRRGSYVQAGIVSWGIGCGDGIPIVYAAVSEAVCWIDMVVSCRTNGGSSSYFGYTGESCRSLDPKYRLCSVQ